MLEEFTGKLKIHYWFILFCKNSYDFIYCGLWSAKHPRKADKPGRSFQKLLFFCFSIWAGDGAAQFRQSVLGTLDVLIPGQTSATGWAIRNFKSRHNCFPMDKSHIVFCGTGRGGRGRERERERGGGNIFYSFPAALWWRPPSSNLVDGNMVFPGIVCAGLTAARALVTILVMALTHKDTTHTHTHTRTHTVVSTSGCLTA